MSVARYYRVRATGQWCGAKHQTEADSLLEDSEFLENYEKALGLMPSSIIVVESNTEVDPRDGVLLVELPESTGPTLFEQLTPLAQPLVDNIEAILNTRNPAQPLTPEEKAALRQRVLHLVSRGEIPAA